ncbi:uridine kinase [Haloplasma contractile]|uniref:Uridine kinase n=1 Tax=Haloplasma contractile SSD-17B TaxID=1033810 RepID=U2FLV1_9MOLU|nr:uridine kinase [Haloplasma contractile]ERJ13720.1 Uridine kinase protein [Haloplasma contractile SSD-17B]
MSKSVVIGIAGGTASGKTTVTKKVASFFDGLQVTILRHDDYYKDQSHLTIEERLLTNYDHPHALDNELMSNHISKLINGNSIDKPTYDFSKHTRSHITERINPTKIIIVEGILVLEEEMLRDLMDIKIYVDTDDDIRFIRRLMRDLKERGRDIDSVVKQYINTVKPMHNQFVMPSKRYADLIIPEGGQNQVAIDVIVTKIKHILS